MVALNAEIFRLSGELKQQLPFYKWVSTPRWMKLVRAEDEFYAEAIALCDQAVLELSRAVEQGTLGESQFYFLSYLLSRQELSIKDVTVSNNSPSKTLIPSAGDLPVPVH